MANRCRGCKREISKGQKNCYLCGATQSYFRFYLKSATVILLVLGGIAASSFWYMENKALEVKLDSVLLAQAGNKANESTIAQLTEKVAVTEKALKTTEEKLSVVQLEVQQSRDKIADIQLKLDQAEKEIVETDKRAGWLLKLNRQLKAQVKELQQKSIVEEPSAVEASAASTEPKLEVEPPVEKEGS